MGAFDDIVLGRQAKDGKRIRALKQRKTEEAIAAEMAEDLPKPPRKRRPRVKEERPNPISALPPKKQKYAQLVADGHSRYQAALQAGYSPGMAKNPQQIETADYRAAFEQVMRDRISPDQIAEAMTNAIRATKTLYACRDGVISDTREVPDHSERRRAAVESAQLTGYWNPKSEVDVRGQLTEATARALIEVQIMTQPCWDRLTPEEKEAIRASHVGLDDIRNPYGRNYLPQRTDQAVEREPHQETTLSAEEIKALLPKE